MSTIKEYFAFISYQRKDEKVADNLRHTLEHYHLPSNVRKENPSFPKTICPIFRDALELSGGVLSEQIEQALEQSKYLIVICSPNSAKSPWVNKEVQTFIRMGKERKIIPFIIDGEPNIENPDTECFPPALRELNGSRELLGININELGREAAAVKVVACMFGLKFDSLWQRFQREQKRKKWMMVGAAILFALVSLGIGLYIERKNIELDTANQQLEIKQTILIADKISQLVDDGNSYFARLLAMEILPDIIEKLNRPYVAKIESAFRKACKNNTTILNSIAFDITFSSCSKQIISADGQTIKIWDVDTGKLLKISDDKIINNCSFSPNRKQIAIESGNGTIEIWDIKTDQLLKTLGRTSESIKNVTFSPNGKQIAISYDDDGVIEIWNIDANQLLKTLEGPKDVVRSMVFSPDGKQIAICYDNAITTFWDLNTNKLLKTLEGIGTITFNPNGKQIVTRSLDGTMNVWDLDTSQLKKTLDGIYYIAFSPDGKQIATVFDGNIITIWDTDTGHLKKTLSGHTNNIYSIAFSLDGKRMATSSRDGTIRLWDTAIGADIKIFKGHTEIVNSVIVSPDGKQILSASHDNTIKVWDIQSGIVKTLLGHTGNVYCSLYSPDGKWFVSCSEDGNVNIWDATDEIPIKTLAMHCNSLALSPDGKKLVTEKYGNIGIWDMLSGNCICTWEGGIDSVMLVYNPNGKQIASSCRNDVNIWDVGTGKLLKALKGPADWISSIVFSPDGKQIVLGSNNGTITFWDTETGRLLRTLEEHTEGVESLAFSPSGKQIVSGSKDGTITVWDTDTGEHLETLIGHTDWVNSVVFSPDGKQIISGSSDKTIRVWPFKSLQELLNETHERFKNYKRAEDIYALDSLLSTIK